VENVIRNPARKENPVNKENPESPANNSEIPYGFFTDCVKG
jgi:hypothetical protein